jgi:hypothetical protein
VTAALDRYGHLFPDELQRLAEQLQEAYTDAGTDSARTEDSETVLDESKEHGASQPRTALPTSSASPASRLQQSGEVDLRN